MLVTSSGENKLLIFDDFESREAAFLELTGIRTPKLTGGARPFFRDVFAWSINRKGAGKLVAAIHSDTKLSLVFATVRDELFAAAARAGRSTDDRSLIAALELFHLSSRQFTQSVRSLSGGERALLAIVKCYLLRGDREIVICSPAQALSVDNRSSLTVLLETLTETDWSLLTLRGEELLLNGRSKGQSEELFCGAPLKGPEWFLRLNELTVDLNDVIGLNRGPALTLQFETASAPNSNALRLVSPVLWSAPNGTGKSTLAALLCGALRASHGSVRSTVRGYNLAARALFQDPVPQLFGRAPLDYLAWSFRESKEGHSRALDDYRVMENNVRERLISTRPEYSMGSHANPDSFLQSKLALVAARLAEGSNLLILDEPSFGLSKSAAVLAVEAIAKRCQERQIALLIVSHLDWFDELVASHLDVQIESVTSNQRRLIISSRETLNN